MRAALVVAASLACWCPSSRGDASTEAPATVEVLRRPAGAVRVRPTWLPRGRAVEAVAATEAVVRPVGPSTASWTLRVVAPGRARVDLAVRLRAATPGAADGVEGTVSAPRLAMAWRVAADGPDGATASGVAALDDGFSCVLGGLTLDERGEATVGLDLWLRAAGMVAASVRPMAFDVQVLDPARVFEARRADLAARAATEEPAARPRLDAPIPGDLSRRAGRFGFRWSPTRLPAPGR